MQRGGERRQPLRPLDVLAAMLWCAATHFALLLSAYWLAGAIYSR
jgi:hypothetical protein